MNDNLINYQKEATKLKEKYLNSESKTPNFFNDKKVFLHDNFARYLIQEHHFILLDNTDLYCFKDTHYKPINERELNRIIVNYLPSLTERQRKEVYSSLLARAEKKVRADPCYLSLNNGVFNIITREIQPITPTVILTSHLNINYDEAVTSDILERFINDISNNDTEIRMLLEEIIGYSLYANPFMQKCFIFYAGGSNGKSAFLKLLSNFFGYENITQITFNDFTDDTKINSLRDKILSVGDDISASRLKESDRFKKLVTGEDILLNIKYRVAPITLNNKATLIFSCNQLPEINDTTYGLYRRLIIIPFNNTFKKELGNLDLNINEKLNTNEIRSALFNIALKGLSRLLVNQEFTYPKEVGNLLKDYRKSNNSVLQFIDEIGKKNIIRNSTKDVHDLYIHWAVDNGERLMTQRKLTKQINEILHLKSESRTIKGKSTKCFLPIN